MISRKMLECQCSFLQMKIIHAFHQRNQQESKKEAYRKRQYFAAIFFQSRKLT